jgi:hypothetical protein
VNRTLIILVIGFAATACSEKSSVREDTSERVNKEASPNSAEDARAESRPEGDQIAEDCVAFVSATKTLDPRRAADNCKTCLASDGAVQVFRLNGIRTDRVPCSETACDIIVTIRAIFNPSSRNPIGGGLTAWISPEQREQWLRGQTPEGEQVYAVKITYRREGPGWRAIEFDRAPAP